MQLSQNDMTTMKEMTSETNTFNVVKYQTVVLFQLQTVIHDIYMNTMKEMTSET